MPNKISNISNTITILQLYLNLINIFSFYHLYIEKKEDLNHYFDDIEKIIQKNYLILLILYYRLLYLSKIIFYNNIYLKILTKFFL